MTSATNNPFHVSTQRIFEVRNADHRRSRTRAQILLAALPHRAADKAGQRAAGQKLLESLVASTLPAEYGSWSLWRANNGAPRLRVSHRNGPHAVTVSLSHSGDYLLAGLCLNGRIGVDVERHHRRGRAAEISAYLNWPIPDDEPGSFLPRWTLWEAGAKCLERGVLHTDNPGFRALDGRLKPSQWVSKGHWHGMTACTPGTLSYTVVIHTHDRQVLQTSRGQSARLSGLFPAEKDWSQAGATMP